MEKIGLSGGGLGFQRSGGRRGCGCCGLWFTSGLLAIPLAVLSAVFLIS